MALPLYLALTAAELEGCAALPDPLAWMACHFSSYGLGLSNLPRELPEGSLLILNDRIPVQGHDPQTVTGQLAELAEKVRACGVLLDFQRPDDPRTEAIVRAVTGAFPCPTAVSQCYAGTLSCPVFLDAPRAYHSLRRAADRWKGRELWLEVSLSPGTVTVTSQGSRYQPGTLFPGELPVHREDKLHCHYCMEKTDGAVRFHFKRTPEDLSALLEEAGSLGITKAIGLYQELGYPLRTQ